MAVRVVGEQILIFAGLDEMLTSRVASPRWCSAVASMIRFMV
jgi:hypothetical protein